MPSRLPWKFRVLKITPGVYQEQRADWPSSATSMMLEASMCTAHSIRGLGSIPSTRYS